MIEYERCPTCHGLDTKYCFSTRYRFGATYCFKCNKIFLRIEKEEKQT